MVVRGRHAHVVIGHGQRRIRNLVSMMKSSTNKFGWRKFIGRKRHGSAVIGLN